MPDYAELFGGPEDEQEEDEVMDFTAAYFDIQTRLATSLEQALVLFDGTVILCLWNVDEEGRPLITVIE